MNIVIYKKQKSGKKVVNNKLQISAGPDSVWLRGDRWECRNNNEDKKDPVDISWKWIGIILQRQQLW